MSDGLRQDESIRVRKRDGGSEPLIFCKLTGGMRRALEASGEAVGAEAVTAAGLAEAIRDHLRRTAREEPIDTRYLSELVELVLLQTGHQGAAAAFHQYQSLRDQQRRRLMVASPRPADGRYVQRRWDKSLVVQHLRRQHGIEPSVARFIAGRVEQLVFSCGLRVVTGGLVYEVIKSELLAWGLLPSALLVKKTRQTDRERRISDK